MKQAMATRKVLRVIGQNSNLYYAGSGEHGIIMTYRVSDAVCVSDLRRDLTDDEVDELQIMSDIEVVEVLTWE